MSGHTESGMLTAAATALAASPAADETVRPAPAFAEVYERWFDFVWRSVRRLGVPESAVEDVVQDVFVIVHRRLDSFEGRSTVKTWIYGITRRVVKDYRRSRSRKPPHEPLRDSVSSQRDRGPMEEVARVEAAKVVHRLLDQLDDDKREAFVLAELEQMTVPEIAEVLGVNQNTVYSRLRAARRLFEQAVSRHRAREGRREP